MHPTIRPRRPRSVSPLATLTAACLAALPATTLCAAPLDPTAFGSLGTLNVLSGTLSINTDSLTISGPVSFSGTTFDQGPLTQNGVTDVDRTVAVFDFSSVNIGPSVTINVTGSRPLALLSRSTMTIAAPIQLPGGVSAGGPAGGAPGGTSGADGAGPGGGRGATAGDGMAGDGGSFGGIGAITFDQLNPAYAPTYGDLLSRLQGGSGGGGASSSSGFSTAAGGGGGAIELGALTSLSLAAPVSAPGGSLPANLPPKPSYYAGAGSGGAILLHAPSLSFSSLSANGGNSNTAGGPGGGGRVALATSTLTPDLLATYLSSVSLAGGTSTGAGPILYAYPGALAIRADTFAVPAGQSITLPTPSPGASLSIASLSIPSNSTATYSSNQFLDPTNASADVIGTLNLGPYSQTLRSVTGTGPISLNGGTLSLGAGNLSSTLSNPLTGTGTLSKIGAGTLTVAKGGPSVTLSVTAGTLLVNASVIDSSSFSVAPTATLQVTRSGRLIANGTGPAASNAGTVYADGSSTLDFTDPFTNTGTITGRDATFRFTGGLSNSGTFEAGAARDVYGPVSNVPNGSITVSGSGTLTTFHSPLTTSAASTLSVSNGSTLFLSAGVTGSGSLSNSGTIRIDAGPSSLSSVTGGGTLTLSSPATLTVNSLLQSSLTVQGTLALNPNGGPSEVSSLTLPTGGTLDLANNPFTLDYAPGTGSPLDTIRQQLLATRIRSTTAANDPQHHLSLAYAEASALPLFLRNTVAGLPIDDTAVLVKLAYLGDANFDGQVNADDYALLDRSYARAVPNAHWTDGDFNYDGTVDSSDYLLIDTTLGQVQGFSPGFLAQRESQFGEAYVSQLLAAVPEPSSVLACFACFGLSLSRRARRGKSRGSGGR